MKKITRILALTLMLASLFSIAAVPAHAEDIYVYKTITDGVSFKPLGDKYEGGNHFIYVYKYVLKSESLVKIDYSSNYSNCYFTINKNKPLTNTFLESLSSGKGTIYRCLEKGTYYVTFRLAFGSTAKFKFTSTPQEEINKENYNKAKAIPLKAKNWVNIAQTPNYNYARWYKIRLTKKQVIHIVTNEGAGDYIRLYNAQHGEPSVARGSKQVFTQDKQPKGTYYIRVSDYNRSGSPSAYIHMKWY